MFWRNTSPPSSGLKGNEPVTPLREAGYYPSKLLHDVHNCLVGASIKSAMLPEIRNKLTFFGVETSSASFGPGFWAVQERPVSRAPTTESWRSKPSPQRVLLVTFWWTLQIPVGFLRILRTISWERIWWAHHGTAWNYTMHNQATIRLQGEVLQFDLPYHQTSLYFALNIINAGHCSRTV
jgi:hypothetical protein